MATINLSIIKRRCRIVPKTECWEWTNCVQANGYGRIRHDGRTQYVHRVAYQLAKGEIAPGKDVCHSCDNRRCCNPDHLFLGSRLDNMRDCASKGRVSRGLLHSLRITPGIRSKSSTKLSMDKARQIRARVSAGEKPQDVSKAYGVDVSSVRLILANKTWREPMGLASLAANSVGKNAA